MSLSFNIISNENQGTEKSLLVDLTFDDSYPTGGEALTASSLGLAGINSIDFISRQDSTVFYDFSSTISVGKNSANILVITANGDGAGVTGATSGGTPSGTNGTSSVSGTLAQANGAETTSVIDELLYTGTVTGDVLEPYTAITLSQAVSGATATVTDYDPVNGYFVISETGTFDTTNLVTGTNDDLSNFTFTPTMAVVNEWTLSTPAAWLYYVTSDTPTSFLQISPTTLLTTATFRQTSTTTLETLKADGGSSLDVGSVGIPTVASLTAAAQIFTGNALATHTHTVGATNGSLVEVANGTDLSGLICRVRVNGY